MLRIVPAALIAICLGGMAVDTAHAAEGRNAALLGGLAAGAVLGGALMSGGRPAPAYAAPPPPPPPTIVYEEPEPICHRERRPLFDEYGRVAGYRMVRVCE
ncbi:hypothetical protein [uncultured Alsobacter sp.]|uniref:hypothetical protein n=1 Tax=uncultured Alsobacter sp. TaxID=1748258 RepID=UPI0025E8CB12|nr:hypothetical protein [uncultured Alsobacter sp.]